MKEQLTVQATRRKFPVGTVVVFHGYSDCIGAVWNTFQRGQLLEVVDYNDEHGTEGIVCRRYYGAQSGRVARKLGHVYASEISKIDLGVLAGVAK